MARPTKYNEEIAIGVTQLIRQGYTLRVAAKAFGVSEASLSRWRVRYPDFNKAVIEATLEQQSKAQHLSGVRTYQRKVYLPSYSPEPLIKPQMPPSINKHSCQPQTWLGLPIKPRPLEYEPTDYYLNLDNEQVERIDRNGVLHSCPMWVWEEKHRPRPALPFIADFF